ncbi:MAG: hypothetical protein J3R72DRAFT_529338 [Linnemannia gamsii]|nr:MAG: hypothetical protein J3R72DRAFT_529338 [Linnemannia gamsii]
MKLQVPKIAILALATCVGLIQQAEAHKPVDHSSNNQPNDITRAEHSADFKAANNGHHHHGHHGHHHHDKHHHHKKHPHKKHHDKHHHHKDHRHKPDPDPVPEPEPEYCEQVDLVCDRVVIDSITCRPPKAIAFSAESIPDFQATSNQCAKKECKKITFQRYVNMALPCYKTPQECGGEVVIDDEIPVALPVGQAANPGNDENAGGVLPDMGDPANLDDDMETDVTDEIGVTGAIDEIDDGVADDDASVDVAGAEDEVDDEDDEDEDEDEDEDYLAEDDNEAELLPGGAAQQPLHKRDNHGHRRHHKKHGHHHKKHGHHHKKHGQHHHKNKGDKDKIKEKEHPWVGLCTSTGEVCGNELFGCDFMASAIYSCSQVGATPYFLAICSDGCKNGACTGGPTPPVTSEVPTTTVSEVPTETCTIQPTTQTSTDTPTGSTVETTQSTTVATTTKPPVTTDTTSVEPTTTSGTKPTNSATTTTETTKPTDSTTTGTSGGTTTKTSGSSGPDPSSTTTTSVQPSSTSSEEPPITTDGTTSSSGIPTNSRTTTSTTETTTVSTSGGSSGSTEPTSTSQTTTSTTGQTTSATGGPETTTTTTKTSTSGGTSEGTTTTTTTSPTSTPTPEKCKCTEVGTFCGSSFDATLCADILATSGLNSVYTCKEVGAVPELTQACPARQICLANGNTAECGANTCDCTGVKKICSSAFKESCGLVANTVYTCSESGEPEKVETCEDNEECVTISDDAVCASKECKCPQTGILCGVHFPLSCNLTATALYKCEVGEAPVEQVDCKPGKCATASLADTASAGDDEDPLFAMEDITDYCIEPCSCTSAEDTCGSHFPADCDLNPYALYSCAEAGGKPEESEICESGSCIVNPGADECAPITDPCICSEKGTFCGSIFPKVCGLESERIYECAANTGNPAPLANCTNGCSEGKCNEGETTTTTATSNTLPTPTTTDGPTTTPTTTEGPTSSTTTDGPVTTEDPTTTTDATTTTNTAQTTDTTATVEPTTTMTTTTTAAPTTTTAAPTTTDDVTTTDVTTTTDVATTTDTSAGTTTAPPATTTTAPPTTTTTAPPVTTTTAATTTTTTTTTTAVTTTTRPPLTCEALVETFKKIINTAFDSIKGFAALVPEPLKSMLSPIFDTLEKYKDLAMNALTDAGGVASMAASALTQIVAIATTFKSTILELVPAVAPLFDVITAILNGVAKAAQDVATCMGAPKNCNGLLTLLGYVLKAALPLIQKQVDGMGTVVAMLLSGVMKTLETTIDKMISGASDAASSLKSLVDTISGLASFLPKEVKLPLDILKAILDTVDACNKTK